MSGRRGGPTRKRKSSPAGPPTSASQARTLKQRKRQAATYTHWAKISRLDPTSSVTFCAYVVMTVLDLGRSYSRVRGISVAVQSVYGQSPTCGPLVTAVMTCVRRREELLSNTPGASGRLTADIAAAVAAARPGAGGSESLRVAERVTRAACVLSLASEQPWTSFTGLLVSDVRLLHDAFRPAAAPPTDDDAAATGAPDPRSLARPCGCPAAPLAVQVDLEGEQLLLECTGDQLCPVDAVGAVLLLHRPGDDNALLLGLSHGLPAVRKATRSSTAKRIQARLRAAGKRLPGLQLPNTGPTDPRSLDRAGRLMFCDALDPMFAFAARDTAWAHLLRALGRRDEEVLSTHTDGMRRGAHGWDVLITLNKLAAPEPGHTAQPEVVRQPVALATHPEAVRAVDRWWLLLSAIRPERSSHGQPPPGPFIPSLRGKSAFRRAAKAGTLNPQLTRVAGSLGLPRVTSQGGKHDHLTSRAEAGETVDVLASSAQHVWVDTTWRHYFDWSTSTVSARVLDPRLLPAVVDAPSDDV